MDKFKKRYDEKSKELKTLNSEYDDIKSRKDFIESTLKNALVRKRKIQEQIDASEEFIELYEAATHEVMELERKLSESAAHEKEELVKPPAINEDVEQKNDEPLELFTLKKVTVGNMLSVNAKLAKVDGKYVILKGSLICKDIDDDTVKWYRIQNKGKINESYELTQSIPFNYLETATSFVLGYRSSGVKDWINDRTNESYERFHKDK